MHFIVKSDDDGGEYHRLESESVVCDEEHVQIGDKVKFFLDDEEQDGEVILFSKNKGVVDRKMTQIRNLLVKKRKSTKSQQSTSKRGTRSTVPQAKKARSTSRSTQQSNEIEYSFDDELMGMINDDKSSDNDESETSEGTQNAESSTTNSTGDTIAPNAPTAQDNSARSPPISNDSTPPQVENSLDASGASSARSPLLPLNNNNVQQNETSNDQEDGGPNVNDVINILENDTQLYGKDHNEEMIRFSGPYYCRKTSLSEAFGGCKKSSSLARRMIQGVFKKDAVAASTLTGQAVRSLGEQRRSQTFQALHSGAVDAIIDFSIAVGAQKNWKKQTKEEIKASMQRRITEVHREIKDAEQTGKEFKW
ncbi:hypothetical protein QAD02_022405 [Eretmocerus hayati]|uniref:Uncharacterized protein n=2 Tax=Eretmocerus hayati TaxID=131215 RepID=A0ACC2PUJ3_9HYME|nr:hypothetical protein QAD02_014952 [Eretmocerus hayati]KAJ8686611.1 hypothetical protein QAD02_022405 [Eretmocerus hayati]